MDQGLDKINLSGHCSFEIAIKYNKQESIAVDELRLSKRVR